MEFKELKNKSKGELQKILTESRDKLQELRFKVASGQLKNVREIRNVKKIVAKIMFLLSGQPKAEKPDQAGKMQATK